MSNNKTKKTISIIRWITRIIGILIALLFCVFFIGETDFSKPFSLPFNEVILILFIPVTLIIGIIIAWKREILGGIIIAASVLLFNITAYIAEGFSFEMDFGIFAFVGLLYIICGVADRRIADNDG